jgi:hypothetical protein
MESCEKDIPLQETLKKVLNFTAKGWAVAREHASRAVSTDNRMRIWCSDDKLSTGLLFKCHLGRIDLESPVGECCPARTNVGEGWGRSVRRASPFFFLGQGERVGEVLKGKKEGGRLDEGEKGGRLSRRETGREPW